MYVCVMPAVASARDRWLCDSVQGVGCIIHALLVTCKLNKYQRSIVWAPYSPPYSWHEVEDSLHLSAQPVAG